MGIFEKIFGKSQQISNDEEINRCFIDTLASFLPAAGGLDIDEVKKWSIEKRFLPEIHRRISNISITELQFITGLKAALWQKGYTLEMKPNIFSDNKDKNLDFIIQYIKSNVKRR